MMGKLSFWEPCTETQMLRDFCSYHLQMMAFDAMMHLDDLNGTLSSSAFNQL